MSTDEYVPTDEDAVDNYVSGRGGDDPGLSLAELRAEYGPEFDRFLAKVKRDAFEKGIATGYMRGYHDSEVGLLYSPPIPPTTPEEAR